MATSLCLDDITWAGNQLVVDWRVDRYRFSSGIWYETVDLDELAAKLTPDAMAKLVFHIAMFEINKGVSFAPGDLRIADRWLPYLTAELAAIWARVVGGVWAQWRYQHDRPRYRGPSIEASGQRTDPIAAAPATGRSLWFCGGGKDSLLAGHLLESAEEPHDAFCYAHTVYGPAASQFRLLDGVTSTSAAAMTHRAAMFDTALEVIPSRTTLLDGVEYVLAAETPASLFAALPIAVTHGHRRLVVAHEHSANIGNVVWQATGEDVNHQWGKSLEAETLLGGYIREHLVEGLDFFSILQPIDDAVIFPGLLDVLDRVPLAHSCNVAKPWCMRCPKCAYVWISYKAYLPWEVVDPIFGGVNLLDLPENQLSFRQMLGLEEHTPFECIGQVEESRLAFAIAQQRGLTGKAMSNLGELPEASLDLRSLSSRLHVIHDRHRIPADLVEPVMQIFTKWRDRGRALALA